MQLKRPLVTRGSLRGEVCLPLEETPPEACGGLEPAKRQGRGRCEEAEGRGLAQGKGKSCRQATLKKLGSRGFFVFFFYFPLGPSTKRKARNLKR